MDRLFDLSTILKCPDCVDAKLTVLKQGFFQCSSCGRIFENRVNDFLNFLPSKKKEMPEVYQDQDYLKWQTVFPEVFESRGYFQKWIDASTHRWIASAFAGTVFNGTFLGVDLGCGTGDYFEHTQGAKRIIGLDINPAALRAFRKKHRGAVLLQADIGCLPFKTGSLDCVFALHVFEHLYFLDSALDEVERVIKHDGRIFVGLPCEGGWSRDLLRRVMTVKKNSSKYGIDYLKVARIEHCHKIYDLIKKLKKRFEVKKTFYFPFSCFPYPFINLTVSMELCKRKA